MKTISASAFLVAYLVFSLVTGVRSRDDNLASEVLVGHQKVVKDFVRRVLKPQLERAEALAGEMEEWLPHAADSLRSIDEGCSSSSLNEIRSSYEKAQSVVTHCITVQEIVKRRGPMKGLHVDERRRLFEKYKTQYYPSAQLVCVSISAGYDQTCERLSLVQNQNQLRTIYLPAGE